MAQSYEMENGGKSHKKDPCSEHPLGLKQSKYSVPKIDRHLGLKWGLALLGKERGKEYLQWLQNKLNRQPQ